MSTFPQSIFWSSKAARMSGVLAVVLATVAVVSALPQPTPKNADQGDKLPSFLDEFQAAKPRALPLFLDDFLAETDTPLIEKAVRFPSAVGPVNGFWVRPEHKQPLPAVLLVYDEDSWTDWMKLNSRHLASIGYEVLTVNVHERRRAASRSKNGASITDEATLAELSAAVRWLRSRTEVLPNRLGVVGWNWSGGQALALASATALQACVVCDAPLPSERVLIVGLRETPVLGVFGGHQGEGLAEFRQMLAAQQTTCKFHVVNGVHPGFLGPPDKKPYSHDAAEDAWVAIYHFLEKHVEDARPANAVAREALKSTATIADIMLAVNDGAGLRGALGKALEQEPSSVKQWQRIRANAAVMAEAGGWLQTRTPAKGSESHWKEQAQAFRAAAETLVQAADQREYAAARRALQGLSGQCAACHQEHR
jgi:dienelactone hydrolase